MATSECTTAPSPPNGPGVLSLCFQGHSSGVGVKEAAGLAGSQGLLLGRRAVGAFEPQAAAGIC